MTKHNKRVLNYNLDTKRIFCLEIKLNLMRSQKFFGCDGIFKGFFRFEGTLMDIDDN